MTGRRPPTAYEHHTRHDPTSREFMLKANCRSDIPTSDNIRARAELFFPGTDGERLSEQARRRSKVKAKAICHHCPVQRPCEQYRAAMDINFGVWAGVAEDERPHGGRA
jgi:hypothetical protein